MRSRSKALLTLGAALAASQASAADLNFVTEPFAPYSYPVSSTDTTAAGPMADIVQAVCARIKVTCRSEVYPWRRAYSMVSGGEVDGMFSLMPTDDRKAVLYFSDEIVGGAYTFFAQDSDRLRYHKPGDLNGRTVAVYGPSGTSIALESILSQTSVESVMEVSNDILLKKLISGRYGAHPVFLMNRDVALALMKEDGVHDMKPVGDLLPIGYSVAFSRKRVRPMQFIQFNQALRAMIKEGTIKVILTRYRLKEAPKGSV